MADNTENRLMALEHAFRVLLDTLQEKRVLTRKEITQSLHQFEESLRDMKATEQADAVRELRKRVE